MIDGSTLNMLRLPARLNVEQVAELLGFAVHDIPVLVRQGALHPLGKPQPNAQKWFAASEIELLSRDKNWLSKATLIISRYWARNNKKRNPAEESVASDLGRANAAGTAA
jgi:hypothetical protein